MSHPNAETLGAFLEGTLSRDELSEVKAHLRDCRECRLLVSATARSGRNAAAGVRSSYRWLAIAAAVTAVLIAVPAVRWNLGRRGTIAHLIDAAPRQHRGVEARMSGFAWAPLQRPSRGGAPDPADLKLGGAAGDVLEATANATAAQARHARGDAFLVIGRRSEAIAALEQAAATSNDARVWNDLAAARYAAATDDERPSQLPLALEAADRALAINPKSPEACFNRALILECMELRERARAAWQQYLAIGPGDAWSVEARAHLRALGTAAEQFDRKMLDTLPAADVVRRFPEEVRTWSEGPLLAEWADTMDEAKLARVRTMARTLAAKNGEMLLADAVAAIDAAPPDLRSVIAEGHRLYRDGRVALSRRDCAAAEAKLERAETAFRKGSSPMWVMAANFRASAAFCQHRGAEAEQALRDLGASMDVARYRAAAAQIDWSLAVGANGSGDWASGARAAEAASARYRALGEQTNAAITDSIAAASLDLMGASDRAWTRWIRAAASLDAPRHRARRGTLLRAAALALAHFLHPGAAASILDLALDDLRDDPAQLAAALTERARVAAARDDGGQALRALSAAREAAAGVRDAALRETVTAPIDVADASMRRATDPYGAVAALDGAIAFFNAGRLNRILPDAYLERARAYRAAGDAAAAERDYQTALAEVERQLANVDDADLRLRFMDTATQVVEETVDLHLSRGEIAAAFAAADRTRELPGTIRSQPAADAAVVEYVVLPHCLAIFCLRGGTLTETSVAIGRAELTGRVASFSEAIRRHAPIAEINAEASAMYRLVIAPQRQQLAGVSQLLIVPDQQLFAVPFAALYNDARHEYLVEQFTLRIAPSAYEAAGDASPALEPALVVADPHGWSQPRLPASREEGARIAAMYGATLLAGDDATRERFLSSVSNSAIVHYAGHADSDADSCGALLLADRGERKGILSSAEIARLRLARHPIVVLAACGTFRGDTRHLSGMPNVVRGFLLAGASSVVGSMWEIDDDLAAPLFLAFHRQLQRGATAAAALRATQLALLRGADARLAHPNVWAAVVLTGRNTRRTS